MTENDGTFISLKRLGVVCVYHCLTSCNKVRAIQIIALPVTLVLPSKPRILASTSLICYGLTIAILAYLSQRHIPGRPSAL